MCQSYDKEGLEVPEHECVKNFEGASKQMEAEIALQGAKKLLEKGYKLEQVILDDDSAVIRQLQEKLPYQVEKICDYIHVRRNAWSAMEDLLPRFRNSLDRGSICHLSNCILKACLQCRDDPKELERRFKALVPHMYGQHEECTQWCRFKFPNAESVEDRVLAQYTEGGEEIHPNLRGGVALTDVTLRQKLEDIFNDLAWPDKCMQLSRGGSTQRNESIHNIFGMRVPKTKCFGMSGSANTRYHAGVCYWNDGPSYMFAALRKIGFPVTGVLQEHVQNKEARRTYHSSYKAALVQKRRRVACQQLKKDKNKNIAVDFYQSGLARALDATVDRQSVPEVTEEIGNKLESMAAAIQPAAKAPVLSFEQIKSAELSPETALMVFYDFETNSLSNAEPIEFAAVTASGVCFHRYFLPERRIEVSATRIHHYVLRNVNGELALFRWNDRMETVNKKVGFMEFITFLQDELKASNYDHIILCAHNGRAFDEHILCECLVEAEVQSSSVLERVVFADSLRAARAIFSKKNAGKSLGLSKNPKDNSQGELFKLFFGSEQTGAHWALDDAQNLSKVVAKLFELTTEGVFELLTRFQCVQWTERVEEYFSTRSEREARAAFCAKWLSRVDNHVFLQSAAISKLAKRGVNMQHLEDIFQSYGRPGLVFFLCSCIKAATVVDAHRVADYYDMRHLL